MSKKMKVTIAAFSIILVVGVAIGVVGVCRSKKSDDEMTPLPKNVERICKNTDQKNLCFRTLSNVTSNDPRDYIKVAMKANLEHVIKAFNVTHKLSISVNDNNPITKMSIEDCKEILEFAIDELESSISVVSENNINVVHNRSFVLQNWLSAVITYQQTCLDGLYDHKILKDIQDSGLKDANNLTSMTLDILAGLSDILQAFGLKINVRPVSRRLLALKNDEFPTWLSLSDRKLLEAQGNGGVTPHATVAQDGSGQYKTIKEALNAYGNLTDHSGRFVIYVKEGLYNEGGLVVEKKMKNVFMYGDGPYKSVITGNKSNATNYTTMNTASFAALGDGFLAKSIGFENTAGPEGHQAVALRVQSDMSAFVNCRIAGYQDTLLVQSHFQFYKFCEIVGTIDFIFGDATAVIQDSLITVRRPMDNQMNTITAQGRLVKNAITGLVIQNCNIVPENKLVLVKSIIKSYLGRPWKNYSRTIIMESNLGDFIDPKGWLEWEGTNFLDTLYYAEYNNRGLGSLIGGRVNWTGYHRSISKHEASLFTPGPFIQANLWIPSIVPFKAGLIYNNTKQE